MTCLSPASPLPRIPSFQDKDGARAGAGGLFPLALPLAVHTVPPLGLCHALPLRHHPEILL